MLDKILRLFSGGFRALRQVLESSDLLRSGLQRHCPTEILHVAVVGRGAGRASRRGPGTRSECATLGQHARAHQEDAPTDKQSESIQDRFRYRYGTDQAVNYR